MSAKLSIVSLWAEDQQLAAQFYREVIGLKPLSLHHWPPHFDLDGSILVIQHGRPRPPEDPQPERFPVLAFGVGDLDAAVDTLKEHGVALPWGIESNPASRWVMFHDPAGNLIELAQFAEKP